MYVHSIIKANKDVQVQDVERIPQGNDINARCGYSSLLHCPVDLFAPRVAQPLIQGTASLLLDSIIQTLSTDGIVICLLDVHGLSSFLIVKTEAMDCSVRGRVDCARVSIRQPLCPTFQTWKLQGNSVNLRCKEMAKSSGSGLEILWRPSC